MLLSLLSCCHALVAAMPRLLQYFSCYNALVAVMHQLLPRLYFVLWVEINKQLLCEIPHGPIALNNIDI
jgi:hypothetical protein